MGGLVVDPLTLTDSHEVVERFKDTSTKIDTSTKFDILFSVFHFTLILLTMYSPLYIGCGSYLSSHRVSILIMTD